MLPPPPAYPRAPSLDECRTTPPHAACVCRLARPQAIENSGTAVGVRCKDGIVFGVEKLLASKMLVPGSGRRIHALDEHVGAVRSGEEEGGHGCAVEVERG